jgi:hypothetical protein
MSNTIDVITLRPLRLASLNGMCVNIPANKPYALPSVLLPEALAAGCIPAEQSDVEELRDAQVVADQNRIERDEAIAAAIQLLVDKNDTEDFSPTGVPRITALRDVMGDDSLTSKERDEVWAAQFSNLT